jgi:hypothetical protein
MPAAFSTDTLFRQGPTGWLAHRKVWLAAFFLCLVAGAKATTVVAPEFADLVNQADFIVRAVVKSVTSDYAAPGSHKIVTKVELEVREVIAGTPTQPLILTMLGGKVGNNEMVLEGAPQFHVGDEDILFVQGNGKQIFPLVALMHGRYPIQREPDTGREYMTRSDKTPLQDTVEVSRSMSELTAGERESKIKNTAQALTPAQFIQQIKAAVKPGK